VGNCEVEFSWSRHKAVTIVTAIIFGLSLLYIGGNGTYIIDALDVMVSGFNVVISGLLEIIIFMYYAPQVLQHSAWFSQIGKRSFRYYALRYGALVALCAVLISSLIVEFNDNFTLAHAIRWGWFVGASCLAMVCAYRKK
jgi:NSS family neurotransmitter:Na+ symporter